MRQRLVFPRDEWGQFQDNGFLRKLIACAPDLPDLLDWPSPEDWQERAVRLEDFAKLGLRFSLEEKPGQRARRKLAKDDIRSYERWIFESGEIPTRAENWHDFFNAMIWMNFPRSKKALHGKALEIQKSWPYDIAFQKGKRSPLADRLTCFDEGGVVFEMEEGEVRSEVEGVILGRDDEAKELFVRENGSRFTLFGHGILEVLMKRLMAKEEPLRVNASCIVIDSGPSSCDEKLADYLLRFDRGSPDHGSVVVGWL